jgi:hypothetical protein
MRGTGGADGGMRSALSPFARQDTVQHEILENPQNPHVLCSAFIITVLRKATLCVQQPCPPGVVETAVNAI